MKAIPLRTFSSVVVLLISGAAHARYFSAREGNFLSPDRAGMIDGPNKYQYVRGQPTIAIDPSGRVSFGSGSPRSGWIPVPPEDESMMRIDIDYAASIAIVLLQARTRVLSVRTMCLARGSMSDWNIATVANLDSSRVWQRVATPEEIAAGESRPAGEAGEPLGQRPFEIALSDTYRFAFPDFSRTSIPNRRFGLMQLAHTLIHEWMHHVLRYNHPPGYSPDSPVSRASDLAQIIADEAIPP